MAKRTTPQIDDPKGPRRRFSMPHLSSDRDADTFGRAAEWIARIMGTPGFLIGMTIFCGVWLGWNTLMPVSAQFDPRSLNFTLLTLMLSLQASYAAPLLLLAQNRQDDRDGVQAESDRHAHERAHNTTDFITREVASLRLALNEVATRDYVRGELRDLLEELQDSAAEEAGSSASSAAPAGASHAPDLSADAFREELRQMIREELHAALTPPPSSEDFNTGKDPLRD